MADDRPTKKPLRIFSGDPVPLEEALSLYDLLDAYWERKLEESAPGAAGGRPPRPAGD